VNESVEIRETVELVPVRTYRKSEMTISVAGPTNAVCVSHDGTNIEGCSIGIADNSAFRASCTSGRDAKTQDAHVKAVLEVSAPASTKV